MTTANVTPNVTSSAVKVLTFKATTIAAERESGADGVSARDAREARAKAMFLKGGFEYLGRLSNDARVAVAKGATISVPELGIAHLSIDTPKEVACATCGQVHRLDDPKLSAKITFYKASDGKVLPLSESCRENYLHPVAQKAISQKSIVTYRNDFPGAKKR